MNEPENNAKVSLEELLRLKRAERPPAEFWAEFDRSLRQKQLAAIVDPRPRWRVWLTPGKIAALGAPLGAASLFFVAFGLSRITAPQPAEQHTTAGPVAAVLPSRTAAEAVPALVAVREKSPAAPDVSAVAEADAPAQTVVQDVLVATPQPSVAHAPASVPAAPPSVASGRAALVSAVVFPLVGDLSSAAKISSALGDAVGRLGGLDLERPVERAAPEEPLAQIPSPQDSRRQRLLAYTVALDAGASAANQTIRTSEKTARRLSQASLSDSMTRLGLTGESVSIRF